MRTLVDVLEDAARRSAFEVVLGSSHATVFTTPWGRELQRRELPGAGLFELLSEVISDEQQIELAVGNAIELALEAGAEEWMLRAKSGTEGITIFATCPKLAAAAEEQARARASDPDAPMPRHPRPSSSSIIRAAELAQTDSETSGQPFHDIWGEQEDTDEADVQEPDESAPEYIQASESSVWGLPSFDELGPEDAMILIPEAWVQAEELAKEARKQAALEPKPPKSSDPAERGVEELHAHIADQARTVTSLRLELAQTRQELAEHKRTLGRHDRAIRQLHKRLLTLEGKAPPEGESGET